MKLGFYLFAEYINMFISGVVMSTLFFGGYDIPFVNEASMGQSLVGGTHRICGIDVENRFFSFSFSCGYDGQFHVSVMIS